MNNIFIKEDYSNNEETSEEEDYNKTEDTFINMTKIKEYEKNRKMLFNKDIIKKNIVIDSHNYYQGIDGEGEKFNTSNFTILFDLENENESSNNQITTNYNIFKNVIGFRLLKTTIRTPPYNVNNTNNIIRYRRTSTKMKGFKDSDSNGDRDPNEILSITINPGVYSTIDLSNVFQQFEGYYDNNIDGDIPRTNINRINAQYVTYSDKNIGVATNNSSWDKTSKEWSPHDGTITPNEVSHNGVTNNTFKLTFMDANEKFDNENSGIKRGNDFTGVKFRFEFNSGQWFDNVDQTNQTEEFEILWDYDSVTRGAARLFGFVAEPIRSNGREIISNRIPNFDSQFVDLVIPEIPSIACKKNSSGRDIIERIQLKEGHGEYLHYKTPYEGNLEQYFNPMKLHRLTTQLWSVNNVLYDNNNSDVSYEFEITMVNNVKLLI